MPMTPALRQWLRQMDGQGAKEDGMKGRGGAMTAHELQQLLLGGACELVKDARDVPTVQEIATVIHNGRKKLRIGKKGQTRAEALQEALNRPELASTILFPPLESRETYILDRTAAHRPWMIFLIAPYAVTVLQRWGKDVVGLDSIYKLSKSHHPVWALVVQDDLGRSWPVAFAVASKERAAVVRFFLSSVRHFFGTQTTTIYSQNTTWQPFVMIDKDKVERNGATSAGFQVLLCDFHTQQLWRKKVAQYGKDDGSVLGLLKRLQHAMTEEAEEEATKVLQNYCQKKRITRFWKYFDKNWLSPPWASTWKSIGRPGHREGLWNTNNATETIFRSVLRDFHCKGTKGDHNLVLTLADNVFRRYNVELNRINVQQQRPSRGVRRLWRRYQEGLRLAQHQQTETEKDSNSDDDNNDREEKEAEGEGLNAHFVELADGVFKWNEYDVSIESPSCTCPYFRYYGRRCKHVFGLAAHLQKTFSDQNLLELGLKRQTRRTNSSTSKVARMVEDEIVEADDADLLEQRVAPVTLDDEDEEGEEGHEQEEERPTLLLLEEPSMDELGEDDGRDLEEETSEGEQHNKEEEEKEEEEEEEEEKEKEKDKLDKQKSRNKASTSSGAKNRVL
ncbi:Ras GTPase-activating protein [Balamuthia mandrillaris]